MNAIDWEQVDANISVARLPHQPARDHHPLGEWQPVAAPADGTGDEADEAA